MKNFRTFKRRKSDRIDVVRLHQLAGEFRNALKGPLDQFLAQGESLLDHHAQKEDYGSEVYSEAANAIRIRKKELINNIDEGLDSWFDWKEGQRPTLKEIEEEKRITSEREWSLMEDHSLERSLAIERFSGRAMLSILHEWDLFFERIKVLTADNDVKETNAPFNSHRLGEIIFTALEKLDVPFLIQVLLFRLFDDKTAKAVSEFYANQNAWLASEGILPNLKPDEITPSRPDRADMSVVNRITQSLGKGVSQGVVIDPEVLKNLLTSVSSLQTQSKDIPDVSDLDAVRDWATSQAKTVTQQFSGSDKSDTIALVSMLFDYFFEDTQLQPVMKHLLARMQIAIIKVAILDPIFFENNQHPARQLLNKMARAASGWQPIDDLETDPLRVGMENIVNRLNDEFEEDIGLFDELLAEFEKLKESYEQERKKAQAKVIEAEYKALAEHQALDRNEVFLNVLLSSASIPEEVDAFLRSEWFRLMHFILDRQGESQNWRNSGRIAKELVWSLQANSYAHDTERFNTIVPKMLGGFEDGLRALGTSDEERDALLSSIQQIHQQFLKESITVSPDQAKRLEGQLASAERVIQGPIPMDIDEPPLLEEPADLNYYLTKIDEITEGQWFAYHVDSERIRIQLAMSVDGGAKYVFTDTQGNKVIERSAIGLAIAIRDNQLEAMDTDPLIDRTLKSVAHDLPEDALQRG